MKYRWVIYDCNNAVMCPSCGGDIEVLTNLTDGEIDAGCYLDGDPVKCIDRCGLKNAGISTDPEICPAVIGDY